SREAEVVIRAHHDDAMALHIHFGASVRGVDRPEVRVEPRRLGDLHISKCAALVEHVTHEKSLPLVRTPGRAAFYGTAPGCVKPLKPLENSVTSNCCMQESLRGHILIRDMIRVETGPIATHTLLPSLPARSSHCALWSDVLITAASA